MLEQKAEQQQPVSLCNHDETVASGWGLSRCCREGKGQGGGEKGGESWNIGWKRPEAGRRLSLMSLALVYSGKEEGYDRQSGLRLEV